MLGKQVSVDLKVCSNKVQAEKSSSNENLPSVIHQFDVDQTLGMNKIFRKRFAVESFTYKSRLFGTICTNHLKTIKVYEA